MRYPNIKEEIKDNRQLAKSMLCSDIRMMLLRDFDTEMRMGDIINAFSQLDTHPFLLDVLFTALDSTADEMRSIIESKKHNIHKSTFYDVQHEQFKEGKITQEQLLSYDEKVKQSKKLEDFTNYIDWVMNEIPSKTVKKKK